MRTWTAPVVLLPLALATGCDGDAPSPEGRDRSAIVHPSLVGDESEHFTFYRFPEDTLDFCANPTQTWERYYSAIATVFPDDTPAPHLKYFKYLNQADMELRGECIPAAPGDGIVQACQVGTSIYASSYFNQHEIVHGVAIGIGRSARFLDEGLAEALSCDGAPKKVPSELVRLEELLAWSGDGVELQDSAALLVSHLLAVDTASFWELFETTHDPYAADVPEAVERIYGTPLKDLYANAASQADPSCVRAWECAGPKPQGEDYFEPLGACRFRDHYTLEVTEDSVLSGAFYAIGTCGSGQVAPLPVPPSESPEPVLALLKPGSYYFTFFGAQAGQKVTFDLSPVDEGLRPAAACDEAWGPGKAEETFGASPYSSLLLDADMFAAGPRVLVLPPSVAFGFPDAISASCPAGVHMEVCEGCPGADNCKDICLAEQAYPASAMVQISVDSDAGAPRVEIRPRYDLP